MKIIKDERNELQTAPFGICEECGQRKRVRKVYVKKQMLGGAPRGYYWFCFNCHGPKVEWNNPGDNTVFISPVW